MTDMLSRSSAAAPCSFSLQPRAAAINDISGSLMEYYTLIQQQDEQLRDLLLCYSDSFSGLIGACNRRYDTLLELYQSFCREDLSLDALRGRLAALSASLVASLPRIFTKSYSRISKPLPIALPGTRWTSCAVPGTMSLKKALFR